MSTKRISVRKIASICNVSPATVSRVINGTASVSPKTKEKILEAMNLYGYPAASQSKLLESETKENSIGILFSDPCNIFYNNIVKDITNYFHPLGYRIFACNTQRNDDLEIPYLKSFRNMNVNGIIHITPHPEAMKYIGASSLPVVMIDNTYYDTEGDHYYNVCSDHFIGGYLAAQELLKKNCTKPLLLLNSSKGDFHKSFKLNGFCKAFADAGYTIPEENLFQADGTQASFLESKELIHYLLAKKTSFDSIFAFNDWRANGALQALKEANIRIPEDIKIVGYDGTRIARFSYPPITSIQQNTAALSLAACKMLQTLMDGKEPERSTILIPVQLLEGKTT